MMLTLTRNQMQLCPYIAGIIPTRYDPTNQSNIIAYDVSDDFIRDLVIELQTGKQTNYTTLLIRLIFKASGDNWDKLSVIYPAECLTIWAYQNIPDFYKQLG